jgi:hypothetical protein
VRYDVKARQRRRLEVAGWEFVEVRFGRSLWWRPGGRRLHTLALALKHVERQERRELEAAGWEAAKAGGKRSGAGPTAVTSMRRRRP